MIGRMFLAATWILLGAGAEPVLLFAQAGQEPGAGEVGPVSVRDLEDTERFLREAKISRSEPIPVGVTHPVRVTLTDGPRVARGIWKTVDLFRPLQRFADGSVEMGFSDSWEHEIAAYELDKLLGLGRVPPVVKRRWRREVGSLQIWLDDVMTEGERLQKGISAPDTEAWNRQMYIVRLLHNLCDDADFNNVGNLLVDKDFRIWIIDHSRSFRLGKELRNPGDLDRFSRELLEKIRELDLDLLTEHLGRWLTKKQIETLLMRRDLILERADRLVLTLGEEKVLYP